MEPVRKAVQGALGVHENARLPELLKKLRQIIKNENALGSGMENGPQAKSRSLELVTSTITNRVLAQT